jgi:hypothetical protein
MNSAHTVFEVSHQSLRSVGETAKDIPVPMRQTRIRFRQRESPSRTLMLGFVALCYFSLAVPGT